MAIIDSKISSLKEACLNIDPHHEKLLLILLGEKNTPDLSQLVEELNKEGIRFAGGIFPGLISGTETSEEGAIILPIDGDSVIEVVKGLDTDDFSINTITPPYSIDSRQTAFVWVDGLAPNIADFLWKLHSLFGDKLDFFGGGAGSLSLQKQACLFTNEGVFQDTALLIFVPGSIKLGVAHGWKKIFGPFVVTKAHKNVIQELNWENAFEVYKKVVDGDSGLSINPENFFEISKSYPFGLLNESGEDVVRDPIMTNEEGALVCVGEVPENSVLNILKGTKENLIDASRLATRNSLEKLGEGGSQPLIVDCISRALFLEKDFSGELIAVKEALDELSLPRVEGVLSLGEISSHGKGFLEFFNKTIVLGILQEQL